MLQLNSPEVEETIKAIYSSDIQLKRIRKELQGISSLGSHNYKVSLTSSQLGVKIIIELPEDSLRELIKEPIKLIFPVIFEIYLDAKFPFVSPRLYCKSNFYEPSLADGRDFIDDVVEQLWTPAILLKDVTLMLTKFIKKINRLPTPESSQTIGKYYVDKLYDLEDFLSMGSVEVLPAQEIAEKGKTEERYLAISESFFLSFAIQDKKTNCVKLLFNAPIKSIMNIKKNKDNNSTLVFSFHDKNKKSGITQNVYQVQEANKLVEYLINIGQKFGMKVNRTVKKLQDLSLEEVTAKSYENIDIEELLEDITIFESKLETDISVDVINYLMALYQKTIEYLSAFNDPAYADFVDRLHSLLNRKDVQVILQSQEEHQNKTGGASKSSRRDEDEEEKKEGPAESKFQIEDDLHNPNLYPHEKEDKTVSLKNDSSKTQKQTNNKKKYDDEEEDEPAGIDLGDNL